jgi:peptidyl-prolyl cis-trans isomerase B (cyclophilin B)
MKKFFNQAALATLVGAAALFAFQSNSMADNPKWKPPITGTKLDQYTAHPKRHLVMETKQGKITLQLFDKVAPEHVANIIELANSHFYDGSAFHRVIPGFMIQGGDPNSKDDDLTNDGTGNGPRRIKAEFNEIHHARGILSAARTSDPNSASCQFFICHADAGFLDKQYTVFGQVIDGIDVVDKIVALPDVTGADAGTVGQRGANPGKAAEVIKVYVEGE